MAVNLNKFARALTLAEGKRVSLPIGQVKEVLRLTLQALAEMPAGEVGALLARFRR